MTILLCLEDSYLRECDATVVSSSGKEIELDRTVFYPRGGGQPGDTGRLIAGDGRGSRVVDVLKKDGRICHEMESENSPFKSGDKVRCVIDWERRYALMR